MTFLQHRCEEHALFLTNTFNITIPSTCSHLPSTLAPSLKQVPSLKTSYSGSQSRASLLAVSSAVTEANRCRAASISLTSHSRHLWPPVTLSLCLTSVYIYHRVSKPLLYQHSGPKPHHNRCTFSTAWFSFSKWSSIIFCFLSNSYCRDTLIYR
jgi:hypothetical protein